MPVNHLHRSIPGHHKQAGFTLIELVIGMTFMVVVIGFMMAAMMPKERESADQIHLLRAAELGQSLLNEIRSKAFDQQSDFNGGVLRCNETGWRPCTSSLTLGVDGAETRADYNDVDDYHGLDVFEDALGRDINDIYRGFSVRIKVVYDNNYDGNSDNYAAIIDNALLAKLITVTVTTPLETEVTFATYKANVE
ncbi:type II secretion system protein [Thalassotalea sp. ND16A]|uniref:type II secretion system protein n=1 Tax=Thalassotalea sp. ND16A TaxID=1535422 RepID=UPI00051A623C|nr:type II secretion system protein [Thalassotalea sp. ND16A]KGJ98944.1 hypothetical protein ND16A_0466 [Thalassotalea sp. ND16A]